MARAEQRRPIRWGRCALIALGVILALNIVSGVRQRPVSPSVEVPRFSDLAKGPAATSREDQQQDDRSFIGLAFNRVLFFFTPPEPDTLVFGSKVVNIDGTLIHRSGRTVSASGYIAALQRWTEEPCTNTKRRIAAANVNQFIFDRRRLLAAEMAQAPPAEGTAEAQVEPVWRGVEGGRMRRALLEVVQSGRLGLAHFGDYPTDEILELFVSVPETSGLCLRG